MAVKKVLHFWHWENEKNIQVSVMEVTLIRGCTYFGGRTQVLPLLCKTNATMSLHCFFQVLMSYLFPTPYFLDV